MSAIGKLERVPLREVWKHEAQDFTQWLQENIDVLNNALDVRPATAHLPATSDTAPVVTESETNGED